MGILSTNQRLIRVGTNYSAGSGIEINDYVISLDPALSGVIDDKLNTSDFETYSAGIDADIQYVSANAGKTYSAGENIGISEDYVISSKDWTTDIANASSNAYEQATALIPPEFDPTYMSGAIEQNANDIQYISGVAITSHQDLSYISGTVDNKLDATAFNLPNSANWNESTNVVETNSAAWFDNVGDAEVNNFVYTNSATINDVDTSYIQNSGTFLTAHQVIPSAKWEDASDVVQSNSAQWSENTGDEEVNNAVYNNSATWNDITVYQTNSANYLTAHQDLSYISGQIDNKLDTTAFSNVSGTFLTAHQDISNKLDTTAFSTVSGNFLTAVDLTPYYTTADANTLSSMLSGAIDYVSANAGDEFPASANEAITAYQNASGTYLTAHQPISANEWNDVYETVETNSGSWAGGTSLTGDAQGAVDEVYSNSADWNSNYSTVNANSGTWTNGGFTGEVYGISGVSPNVDVYIDQNTLWISAAAGGAGNPEVEGYVQTNSASIDEVVSTYETNSGTYLTAHQDISNKLDTTAFSTVSGTFLTAHQDISANEWNSVYDTVEANSGSWAGGGSIDTIPFVVQEPLVTGFSGESAYLGIESTALNLSSYVPVSAIGVDSNYGWVNKISGRNISAYNAATAYHAYTADRAYKDRNSNEITSYYQPKLTIAGDAGTITAINGSAVGASIPEGWELVGSAGISIFDDSENNQTIISVTGGGDLSNYYTKTETSSKIELDNAIGDIETLLASL